jgi:serine/threonine-protein kinase
LKHIEVPMDVYRVVLTGQPLVDVPVLPAAPASSVVQASSAGPVAPALATRLAWKTWAPAAVLLILLASLAGLIVRHYNGPSKAESAAPASSAKTPNTPAAAPVADQKSVAVLPFVNLSADKNDEYLSDGMTEELLNALARVKGLRVPGRASSFAFKDRTGDDIFRQVGSQLHVATVLGGSVRKAGDQLRVTAQLINVADGFCLWSDSYDGDMKDLFALQSRVAKKVAGSLSVELGVEAARELDTPPTINPEAHRQYLLGRFHFDQGSFSGFTAAIPFFQKAVDLDTNYALAYCGMADAYGFTSGILMPGRQGWAKEKALAEKALAIDPDLAEAHFSLGLALASSFHWADGEKEIQRAIAMNTNMAVAYDQYAFLLTCLGRHDEALAMSRRAVELEPLSPLMNIDLGWWLLFARRYEEAVGQCRKAMDLDSHISLGHWALGWSLLWSGDKTNAVMEFERATKLEPQPFFEAPLGYAYAVTGERTKAEQILRKLADSARNHYASPGLQAYPSLGLGATDKVCDWLAQSFEEQDYPCHFLKVDPAFDPLRGDPRFQELLRKAGLNP